MSCPRCSARTVELLATAQAGDAWQVLHCTRCRYSWRTTEPARRTDPDAYPPQFKLSQADLDDAPEVPPVPPLDHRR
jgi:vanillate/4-hydroxybenzoate decarboxylase subunit D